MPFVRGPHAAGKLSIGFWDHWVPGANKTSTALVEEWAAKEKVDVQIDYIPSQGQKLLLTTAAEAQAKSGHDILAFSTCVAALGSLRHVSGRHLKQVENAVEIDGKHPPPFVFRTVDERAPAAAADSGIGEAGIDPAELRERVRECGRSMGWRGMLRAASRRLPRPADVSGGRG